MADLPSSKRKDEAKASRVISRHLDPAFAATPDTLIEPSPSASGTSTPSRIDLLDDPESSLKLQGGDVHRDLYKIKTRAAAGNLRDTRSKSFGGRRPSSSSLLPAPIHAAELQVPGAFRRQFLVNQRRRFNSVTGPVTNNFISFLDLYGSFAGEDLAESDEDRADDGDDNDDDDENNGGNVRDSNGSAEGRGERRPLLGRRKSSRVPKKGDSGTIKTFFLLLKSFIGTGVLFLPKAFKNGGLLFSSITLVVISLVTCLAFHLLLQCRGKCGGGGYGELGEALVGRKMRTLILGSITFSQLGFVCAGIIFTAENLYAFFEAVVQGTSSSNGSLPISTGLLIAAQVVLLIPLALIRNISKLGSSAFLADVCILFGLGYIYYYNCSSLAHKGINKTVELFNPADFTLTVGSAIFTFEGIGLVLPVQSSMKEPANFSRLLYFVMFLLTVVFTTVGGLSYATFGDKTNTEIISNFPQHDKLVNTVQFLYSVAVLVGTPVQLFPVSRSYILRYEDYANTYIRPYVSSKVHSSATSQESETRRQSGRRTRSARCSSSCAA